MATEGYFVVTNASGRAINILNEDPESPSSPVTPDASDEGMQPIITFPLSKENNLKRKYHCTEPGCTKSFTTSGHLARHNRIHTGEKNFPCLFPGCSSRFSRQDNMMQHYRTHMSTKSKRTIKKIQAEDPYPRPRLHAHQRIKSDPYRVERPLTIDQHLNNYRKQLNISASNHNPSPIITKTTNNSLEPPPLLLPPFQQHQLQLKKQQQRYQQLEKQKEVQQEIHQRHIIQPTLVSHPHPLPSPPRLQSRVVLPAQISTGQPSPSPSPSSSTSSANTFYHYKPLTFPSGMENPVLPYSLLHPSFETPFTPSSRSSSPLSVMESTVTEASHSSTSESSSSQSGLLQLANIISTFG